MRKKYICGLDIGSFKICATCGRSLPSGKIDILASQILPAEGVRAGRIVDVKRASLSLREAVEKLSKAAGLRVRRVYANMNSPDLKAKAFSGELLFKKKTRIKKIHIARLVNSCISSQLPLNRKVIHTGVRNFILDNGVNSLYPEGRKVQGMKLDIVLVNALIPTIRNFVRCIHGAGLILEDIVPSGCAQLEGLIREGQEEASGKNNILIDVGRRLTRISFLKDRLLYDMISLPLGAQSITEAIALKLKVSIHCAEELKIKYGRAYSENNFFAQRIMVKDGLTNKTIKMGQLSELIIVKTDELLDQINKALLKMDCEDARSSEVIITGGGSMLEGFLERAEQVLGRPVKMGFLSKVSDSRIQGMSALYATSIGLMQSSLIKRDNLNFFTKTKFGSFMRLLNQAEGLYKEYF